VNVKLLKAKLKAAKAEEKQWAKAYNRAERAMLRIGREIDKLEEKIDGAVQLASAKQASGADDRGAGAGAARGRARRVSARFDFGAPAPAVHDAEGGA